VWLWTGDAPHTEGDEGRFKDEQPSGSKHPSPLPPEQLHNLVQNCLQRDSVCNPSEKKIRTVNASLHIKRSCEVGCNVMILDRQIHSPLTIPS
jgi:hypothetical protein